MIRKSVRKRYHNRRDLNLSEDHKRKIDYVGEHVHKWMENSPCVDRVQIGIVTGEKNQCNASVALETHRFLKLTRAQIGIGQGLLDLMDQDELLAIVAHEYGHLVNEDYECHDHTTEYMADTTGAYLTRNPQAHIRALKKLMREKMVGNVRGNPLVGSDSHPAIPDRIANLERVAKQLEGKDA